jgi:hypothetical protein
MYLPGLRPKCLIRYPEFWDWVLNLTLYKWDLCKFFNLNFIKTGISLFNKMKNCVLTSFWQVLARVQLLEVDPIPGFKYSHLNNSGPIQYRKMVSLELLFVLLCSRTKTKWWRHRSRQKGGAAAGPKIWWLYLNQHQNNSRALGF